MDYSYADEDEIVWLADPSVLPYVRETFTYASNRVCKPAIDGEGIRLIGYAKLGKSAKGCNRTYLRRTFTFRDYDKPALHAPQEALIPSTIRARVRGEAPRPSR